jgi:O-acetyl-ADP-ribose deacetylase (regulator of RNase III)
MRMPLRIDLVLGDITRQQVDVVVNAANSGLLGGGGVDGAIHAAAGAELDIACAALRAGEYSHGLPAGQAVATTGGDLAAEWVVHTVGPVFAENEDRSDVLASCYRESLKLADQLGARSVAFPAISCGVFRWPLSLAARVAVDAVLATPTEVEEIRFVLFTPTAYEAFEAALADARSVRLPDDVVVVVPPNSAAASEASEASQALPTR